MKISKLFCLFITLIFVISIVSLPSYAEENSKEDEINVLLNEEMISFDQPPVMVSDRVLVPIRAIFEKLNYEVSWDEDTKTATSVKDDKKIFVQIDNPVIKYTKNKQEFEYICDVAPTTLTDRTMVPLRAISECAGCDVTWSDSRNTVYIFSRFSDEKYTPDGSVVATVNGVEITDKDLNYFIYGKVGDFYYKSAALINNPYALNWDKATFNDVVVKEYIIKEALKEISKNIIYIQTGIDAGIEYNDELLIEQVSAMLGQHSDEYVNAVAKSLAIYDKDEFIRLDVMASKSSLVKEDIYTNPTKYYPEKPEVLADYTDDIVISAKHILVGVGEGEKVLKLAKKGEDFDKLIKEYNQDPGEGEGGYTFGRGEMVPEFEEAAFALKVNEISDVVRTDYGEHIIKRIAGFEELTNYWMSKAEIKTTADIEKISVNDIIVDAAIAQLLAQELDV